VRGLGIKGERALVLILNHYMKDENESKIKNQINNNNNKLNIKQIRYMGIDFL
jgi:hypothetical protein